MRARARLTVFLFFGLSRCILFRMCLDKHSDVQILDTVVKVVVQIV